MKFHKTQLNDAWLIELEKRGDDRGFFARTMCQEEFAKHGMVTSFVQQNMSVSAHKGTLRGLHYQMRPYAEAKLIRCLRGAIIDIIVDIREESSTYLQHQAFELTDSNMHQLYVPPGFAHSFQTLTDDVEVSYLVSSPYTPSAERGLRYSDEKLGIQWPLPVTTISDKDAAWPLIAERTEPLF
ncbi:dTDP-4-dehydrorhamnose 3,5-epimerase [Pseudomonas matsuisoli]|jgi:dTDP-4-dehydrorhamnose 3,5-epimerase|uniref:dTDP-4-dehydrorhamnose 3,5-epimerase n=1 Tax=Pseudomonas matsuisoli TaxID=1515666 RepID=A0A917Q1C1_9PSED|nr:dTDP-4-dehydrorhamnose 3,5-epimerase [Pseudomonas matsuisoli]GGK05528.1 dTDP-4-dehydrorhamnose 3,5-epimerase [Pseudomonas matsuisoli]